MKAAVTSGRDMSSSCSRINSFTCSSLERFTRLRPSTHPLIHPLMPRPPLRFPANSSILFGKYPIVASGFSNASLACSQTSIDDGVGECGVCG